MDGLRTRHSNIFFYVAKITISVTFNIKCTRRFIQQNSNPQGRRE